MELIFFSNIILAQISRLVCCSTFIKSLFIISFTEISLRRLFGTSLYKNLAISFSVIIPKGLLSLAITTLLILYLIIMLRTSSRVWLGSIMMACLIKSFAFNSSYFNMYVFLRLRQVVYQIYAA